MAFLKATITDDTIIRGAARIVIAPIAQAWPTDPGEIIVLGSGGTDEVQTLTITGTPTGGTFVLSYDGQSTSPISFDATAAAVASALQALTNIGATGVACTGGPLPGTAVAITFGGPLASRDVSLIYVTSNLLTGGTTPTANVVTTTPGVGQYNIKTGWSDLGATKTGCQITRNHAEDTLDVDQINGDILSVPNNWEMSIGTALSEMTLESLQIGWEGGAISAADGAGFRHMGLGTPQFFVQRRLAVLHQRANGKIRAHVFRKVQRMTGDSTIAYNKAGDQTTINTNFKALADSSVADVYATFGEVMDES